MGSTPSGNVYENETFGTVGYRVNDNGQNNMMPGYGGRFTKSGNQSPSGGLDIVTFDGIEDGIGNLGDNMSDGAYVIPADGVYCFTGGVSFNGGGAGTMTVNFQLNATVGNPLGSISGRSDDGGSVALTTTTGPRYFKQNDVVRLGANSGNAYRTILGGRNTYCDMRRLS